MEWEQTRKETTEVKGSVVSERIISEVIKPTKKVFGLSTEAYDLIFKIVGLITIIISIIEYFDKVKNEQQQRKNQYISDSTANAHYQQDKLRQDSNARNEQLQFQKDLEFKRQSLEATLSSNLRQLFTQRDIEIQKENRLFDVTALISASTEMNVLLHKSPESDSYIESKNKFLYDLKPKIFILDNDTIKIYNSILKFEKCLYTYETVRSASNVFDKIYDELSKIYDRESKFLSDSATLFNNRLIVSNNNLEQNYYNSGSQKLIQLFELARKYSEEMEPIDEVSLIPSEPQDLQELGKEIRMKWSASKSFLHELEGIEKLHQHLEFSKADSIRLVHFVGNQSFRFACYNTAERCKRHETILLDIMTEIKNKYDYQMKKITRRSKPTSKVNILNIDN
ncbi:hypothetical protein ACPPVU_12520 [Mucilaginibacter sp. McL0603]|uniref:hypothetical protein n=1 Tax=Mucilaginibacter sp. McL0603 TaxID=3415670 RepID=UPI003CF5772E